MINSSRDEHALLSESAGGWDQDFGFGAGFHGVTRHSVMALVSETRRWYPRVVYRSSTTVDTIASYSSWAPYVDKKISSLAQDSSRIIRQNYMTLVPTTQRWYLRAICLWITMANTSSPIYSWAPDVDMKILSLAQVRVEVTRQNVVALLPTVQCWYLTVICRWFFV